MGCKYRVKDDVAKPRRPSESVQRKSVNGKLREELQTGEMFYSLKEMRGLAERWRVSYSTIRQHARLITDRQLHSRGSTE